MVIAVLADEQLKDEFLSKKPAEGNELVWADSVRSLGIIEADAYFDLLFVNDRERTAHLEKLLPKPVFVNSVAYTTQQTSTKFIRINAWPTMMRRDITELALASASQEAEVQHIFQQLGWKYIVVPDVTGMVTPRVVAMIINEAMHALHEGVSTKEQIDTAMKLGTNYPYGPFEWCEKIGKEKIIELLTELGKSGSRYATGAATHLNS